MITHTKHAEFTMTITRNDEELEVDITATCFDDGDDLEITCEDVDLTPAEEREATDKAYEHLFYN